MADCIFIIFICVINYIDRASLSFAINRIDQEFHFTESQNGLLLGAFGIGYVFSTFVVGILADKYGAKLTLGIAALFWSMATLLIGFAQDIHTLIFARVLLGFAEGPIFPCLTRAISGPIFKVDDLYLMARNIHSSRTHFFALDSILVVFF